jgi:hypothetical protein
VKRVGKRIAVERKLWSGLQKMTRGVVRGASIDGYRVDFFVPSAALAICLDDDPTMHGVRRLTYAAAHARGITLLVVTPSPVLRRGGAAWSMIAKALDDAAQSRGRGTSISDSRDARAT